LRYWDASALMPLFIDEAKSAFSRELFKADREILTWEMSWVELISVVERRAREGSLRLEQRVEVLTKVHRFFEGVALVNDLEAVRVQSFSLLARYALRAADAQQLAAASVAANGKPNALAFVCFDAKLADAASREGFQVIV
jgi:uncharacterized protein